VAEHSHQRIEVVQAQRLEIQVFSDETSAQHLCLFARIYRIPFVMPLSSRRLATPFSLTLGFVVATVSYCLEASPRDEAASLLEKTVLPVIEQRCLDCHDSEMKKGDINLDVLFQPGAAKHDIRLWDKVRGQIEANTMPPKTKPPLEEPARRALLDWVPLNEKATLALAPADPGLRKTRRLTREEYNLSLRDLLGVKARPGDKFPADGSGGEGFANNADTLTLSPLLIEKYLGGADEVIAEVWSNGELKARLMKPVTSSNLPGEVGARLWLEPLLRKAYRRPPTEDEIKALLGVFRSGLARKLDWDGACKLLLKAVLTSPKFLFLHEAPGKTGEPPQAVEDYALASRLSYFLWSSIPDEELLKLASENKLRDEKVLAVQVKRMLVDPKGEAFTRLFAGQWLRFEELYNTVDPDRRKFKEFNDTLRDAMHDEILHFSDHLLRGNGRVLDFLDSDYSFLNEALAKHYGIPGVSGGELRQVKFTDPRRGGLLGMGAILATTAYPQRTSPVLRGKWVLEQLLGTPPPPPPPNVGSLPEDDRSLKEQTLRQKLEAHGRKPNCAGCHVRMDPIGFALENFNAIGQWRDQENGKPLDVSGVLPGDRGFNGPAEMRKVLLTEKDKFIRTLCARMLGYALGRGLEIEDQSTLLRLEETLKKNDYRSEALIMAVVQSYPFRYRR
jgi:hypothetical protein